jgi:hypothetical protein
MAAMVTASARVGFLPRTKMAIGLVGRNGDFRIAVRVQHLHPGIERAVELVRRRSRGECDVRLVGRVVKQQPWHRRRNRPLRIGGSIGHRLITAGTLGCFVTARSDGEELILSNNHVLANENDARISDAILQPGRTDGGRVARHRIGRLHSFVALKSRHNVVDAATASMREGIEYYYNWLERLGPIRGVRTDMLEWGEVVYKLGRTTGLTRGRVSAVELDDVKVEYDMGVIDFDDQIEIEPDENKPFSLGGDSGSLVVDSRQRAVGLLFAGNDVDSTFASPIGTVLGALKLDLVY